MDVTTDSNLLEVVEETMEDMVVEDAEVIVNVFPSLVRTPLAVHVVCVVFFLFFGLLANLATIYLFTAKKSRSSGNVYMVALAVLDVMACVLLCPQFPFLRYYSQYPRALFLYLLDALMSSYLYMLVAMSLSRLYAVKYPIAYRVTRHRHKYFAVITLLVTFIGMALLKILWEVGKNGDYAYIIAYSSRVVIAGSTVLSFVTIVVTYSLIVTQLYRTGKRSLIDG